MEEEDLVLDDAVLNNLLEDRFDNELSQLNNNPQYAGFDNNVGKTWIYPTNYPIRQYQYNISRAAIFDNTLVALPTGLGKTFIAAVVMYNFYRWYPLGKIIFLAPTKPLVHQQIEACYMVMGIPAKDTTEMTGKFSKVDRRELWKTKRVFFATPQTIQSELCTPGQEFPLHDIKLLVVDEAHRAKKNYAYTNVVNMIYEKNKNFRVLALSATPGREIDDVIEVIQNLLISRVEIRWDTSLDLAQYIHKKNLHTVIVPLGPELTEIRSQFMKVMDPYMNKLLNYGVVAGTLSTQSKNWIIYEQQTYLRDSRQINHPNHSDITSTYSVLVSLFHALELLERQGIYSFINFFHDISNTGSFKYFVSKDSDLKYLLLETKEKYAPINPFNLNQTLPNETLPDTAIKLEEIQGHPKFPILAAKLAEFFVKNPESKVIVFCEFRDSTLLVDLALKKKVNCGISSRIITGQGSSIKGIKAMSQKEQLAVMKDFKAGVFNTLIATSVCEEGIDVGDVDLIVCFDICTKNPTRFTQRIGRTGRQRIGQVMVLVTEGKEQRVLKTVLAVKDNTNQKIANHPKIGQALIRNLPLMIPPQFKPTCLEICFKVPELEEVIEVPKKKRGNAKAATEPEAGPSGVKIQKKVDKKINGINNFFRRFEMTDSPSETTNSSMNDVSSIIMNVSRESNISPENRFNTFQEKILKMKFPAVLSAGKLDAKTVLTNEAYPKCLKKLILERNTKFLKDVVESESLLVAMEQDDDVVDLEALEKLRYTFQDVKNLFGSIESIKSILNVQKKDNNGKISVFNKFDTLFAGPKPVNVALLPKLLEKIHTSLGQQPNQSFHSESLLELVKHTNSDIDTEQPAFVESKYQEEINTTWNTSSNSKNNIFNTSVKTPISAQARSRKIKCIKKVTTPISESPLFKAFQNTNKKRSITNCSTPIVPSTENSACSELDEKAILGFLGLTSIDDIFEDDSDENEKPSLVQQKPDVKVLQKTIPSNMSYPIAGTSGSFLKRLEDAKLAEKVVQERGNSTESNSLWIDDGMDELLGKMKIPENTQNTVQNSAKTQYSISEINDIIDQLDSEVIESSQPVALKRSGNRSLLEQCGYGDLDDIFCDSESDIFKTTSADSIVPSHNVDAVDKNDEDSNCSDKTVEYNYNDLGDNKENASFPKQVTPTSSLSSEQAKSPSIFNKNLSSFRLSQQTQSPQVLKQLNINTHNHVSSPISSKMEKSFDLSRFNFQKNKLIKPAASSEVSDVALISQSPIGRVVRSCKAQLISSDDDSEEIYATCKTTMSTQSTENKLKIVKKVSRKRSKFSFLDNEAGAVGQHSSDEDSGEDLSGFICDSIITEDEVDDDSTIDIQAKYLESLKSPSNRRMRGVFKIPQVKSIANISDIYSQMPNAADSDEYEEDSFLDMGEDHHCESQLDELEKAEALLKAKRRAKKFGLPPPKSSKRRIIVPLDTDSEDDEMVQLRKKVKSHPE